MYLCFLELLCINVFHWATVVCAVVNTEPFIPTVQSILCIGSDNGDVASKTLIYDVH